jgi:hypothetical protein
MITKNSLVIKEKGLWAILTGTSEPNPPDPTDGGGPTGVG